MKKITEEMVNAVFNKRKLNKSNTAVEYLLQPHAETTDVYLWNNLIARYNHRAETLQIFSCGWYSNTTKERLNGLLWRFNKAYIRQKNFKWYVELPDGEEVDFKEGMILNAYEAIEEDIGA